jgi:hypothetical protein
MFLPRTCTASVPKSCVSSNLALKAACALTKSLELFDPAPAWLESILTRNDVIYAVKNLPRIGPVARQEMTVEEWRPGRE